MKLQEKIRGQGIFPAGDPRQAGAGVPSDCPVPEFGGHDLIPPQNPGLFHPPSLVRKEDA
jgi:NADH-quinone oxidoreductase subunit B